MCGHDHTLHKTPDLVDLIMHIKNHPCKIQLTDAEHYKSGEYREMGIIVIKVKFYCQLTREHLNNLYSATQN